MQGSRLTCKAGRATLWPDGRATMATAMAVDGADGRRGQDHDYDKLRVNRLPSRGGAGAGGPGGVGGVGRSPESKWWRKLGDPVLLQEIGPATRVEYRGCAPHDVLVTSSTRVLMYDAFTRRLKRQFTRFPATAYSGVFRSDGKMIAAGGDSGHVQLFDAGSRDLLRQLRGHRAPVRAVRFAPLGASQGEGDPTSPHVISGGDDATIRYWDIALGEAVATLVGHTDYVRCLAASHAQPQVWLSGSYDHTCRLWDVRMPPSRACVRSWQHAPGSPVEDVVVLPSGAMAASAGGTAVRVWDLLSGRCIAAMDNSSAKTITSLRAVAHAGPRAGDADAGDASSKSISWRPGPRILCGSVDGYVRVFELDAFTVTHATKYPAPVLSFDVSRDGAQVAVGMSNGMVAIRRRRRTRSSSALAGPSGGAGAGDASQKATRWQPRLTASSYRYFLRGQGNSGASLTAEERAMGPAAVEVAAAKPAQRVNLRPFDRALKKFRYKDALDAALQTQDPATVVAVLERLAAHGGDGHALKAALAQRDPASLTPVMRFLCKAVADPRCTKVACAVANQLLDQYATVVGIAPDFDAKVALLYERVRDELRAQETLVQLQGMLEPLLFAQFAASE